MFCRGVLRVSRRAFWGFYKSFTGSPASGATWRGVELVCIWEFPKIRGTLYWGPCNKDPTI